MKTKYPKTFLIASMAGILLAGCGSKILAHGNQLDPAALAKVKPGETRLIEVEALFGRPSAEGVFESGRVYYITQIMEEKPAGLQQTLSRTIVAFSYDEQGVVQAIDITDEESGRNVYHLDSKTPTPGDNYGVLEQIFRNLRGGNFDTQ